MNRLRSVIVVGAAFVAGCEGFLGVDSLHIDADSGLDATTGEDVAEGGSGSGSGSSSSSASTSGSSGSAGSSSSGGSSGSTSGSSSGSSTSSTSSASSGSGSGGSSSTGGSSGSTSSGSSGSGSSSGGSADAGTGAVAVLGSWCSTAAALACAGNAQKVTLICSGGTWTANGTCSSGQNCNSAPGSNQGTCASILSVCANLSPGALACSDASHSVRCGPDLVSTTPVQTCSGTTCSSGACMGVCGPGQTQCSGTQIQTCDSTGQWAAATACTVTGQTCQGGTCQCPSGESVCGTACVNKQTDVYNCGTCGMTCSLVGETCQAGTCACPSGDMVNAGNCCQNGVTCSCAYQICHGTAGSGNPPSYCYGSGTCP